MATKKSPQKNKSSSTRKTSTQTTQAAHTKPQFSEAANRQMWAVFVFAFGILFASMTLIKGQKVWLFFHNFVLGMFGWSAFLIAPIFFYIAIMATLDKPLGSIKHKLWQTFLLVGFISGAVQVFGSGIPIIDGLWNKVKCLFRDGIALEGGGVVSGVFGLPFLNWFGATGAKITMILLIFVSFMVLSGGTLIGLYHSAKKPVKKLEEVYTEKAAQRAEQPKRKPFNIDIPMDEDVKSDEFISPMGEEETIPIPAKQIESKKKRTAAEASESISSLMKKEILPTPPSEQEAVTVEPVQDDIIPIPEETFEPVPMLDDIIGKLLDGEHFEDNDEGAVKTENISDEMLNGIMAEPFDRLSEAMVKEEEKPETYNYPPLDILQEPKPVSGDNITEELKGTAEKLVSTLKSFGVETRIIDIARGPAVTRYELQPSVGVKISKITGLADDIALNLAASGVRIEAPIPNKAAVGIEIPNRIVSSVSIREILDTPEFIEATGNLTVALGKDIAGTPTIADLSKMPHTLIAGSTGSGKSVCINSIIISLLYKSSPDKVKLLMIDPKMVELGIYNGIPHLLVPVVTDPKKAAGALGWAVTEMLNRYQLFKENSVRDLKSYNHLAETKDNLILMPQIVIIIDELADLMMAAPNEVEDSICRLAQMARAAGMHLVIATQRPSVDVITGIIKANIPSRIAFAVSSQVDSRTILDGAGAEKLLGRGDMLFYPVGANKPLRVQGCFVTDQEVDKVVEFIKNDGKTYEYDKQIIEDIERHAVVERKKSASGNGSSGGGFDSEDEMLPSAIECVIEAGQASTSLLQRKCKLGYARAARIIDTMEEKGIVGPFEGSKPRQVLITRERWIEMKLASTQRAKEEWGD